jgi:hypothetical protein
MAEVTRVFETLLRGRDGRLYNAHARGRERSDGMWEGWLEFPPQDGGEPVVTSDETVQQSREDLEYWASGLTDPYLDGALLRALTVPPVPVAPAPPAGTARKPAARTAFPPDSAVVPENARAILDPFHVYTEGDDVLRAQLQALSAAQLRNIIRAYGLSELPPAELGQLDEAALVAIIMTGVEGR